MMSESILEKVKLRQKYIENEAKIEFLAKRRIEMEKDIRRTKEQLRSQEKCLTEMDEEIDKEYNNLPIYKNSNGKIEVGF